MDLKKKGVLLVFLTALVSGASIFINSYSIKGFDSSVFTFSKNIIVALFLFAILLGFNQFSKLKSLKRKHWIQLSLIGLIGGSIPFLLFFKGLQLTTGTTSAFLHKTIFIYITIFALVFLKEKLNKGLFIGIFLLLLGNYFMLKPDFSFSAGHLLILTATLFWAAENTIAKYVLKDLSGTLVAFGRMFFGSLFILIFLAFTGKLSLLTLMSSHQYLWILLTSVFLFTYVFTFYNGLKHIKVSTAACILAIGSPITTLLAFFLQAKPISFPQSIGIFLILAGISSVLLFTQLSLFLTKLLRLKQYGRN